MRRLDILANVLRIGPGSEIIHDFQSMLSGTEEGRLRLHCTRFTLDAWPPASRFG